MKRFLLFHFEKYNPGGGMNDLEERFDTLEELETYVSNMVNKYKYEEYDYIQYLDLQTGEYYGTNYTNQFKFYKKT